MRQAGESLRKFRDGHTISAEFDGRIVDSVAGRGYGRSGVQASQFTRQSPPVCSGPFVVSTDSLIVLVDRRFDALVVASNGVIVFGNRLLLFLLA